MDDIMPGFESPNYTQVPNDLFDGLMKDMDGAELKVVLSVVRQTIGYHRDGAKFSIGKLCKMTGLCHNSVLSGAEAAERRGLIRRANPESQGSAEWEVIITPSFSEPVQKMIDTPSKSEGSPPQKVRGTPSINAPQVGLNKDKERENKTQKKLDLVDGLLHFKDEALKRKEDEIDEILCDLERGLHISIQRTGAWQLLARWVLPRRSELSAWIKWYMTDQFNAKTAWRITPEKIKTSWPQAFPADNRHKDAMELLTRGTSLEGRI